MKPILTSLILIVSTVMIAQTNPQPTVDVTGIGIVNITPDHVNISMRVENTGKDAKTVKRQNDATVIEVFAFVKKMNIDQKDVQTEYIRLSKNYDYNTKTYNYAANQSINVKLRDLSKYEAFMNGLLESGINRIDNVSFSSSELKQLESQARKNAMLDAKMRAQEYAGALNQTIGKAVSISEFSQGNPSPPMFKRAMAMSDESSGGQTIAPGELEIKVTVNVQFLLN